MTHAAYYNEIDPYAAQWLRNLIAAGHIAPGEVDDRSILDVSPDDLAGFTQCHFFAGIGVWSYALRLAQWPDSRPVWTGSCPCQPFSVAGMGGGFNDERHLWPFWHFLIEKCAPPVVFGEQVEAAIKHGWLDLVQADLEGIGYAVGAASVPAGGVGAPHIRQRLWFVANANEKQRGWRADSELLAYRQAPGREQSHGIAESDFQAGELGNNNNTRLEGLGRGHQAESGRQGALRPIAEAGELGGVEYANQERLGEARDSVTGQRATVGGSTGGMAHTDLSIAEQLAGQRARPGEAAGAGAHDQFDGRGELAQGQPTSGTTDSHWSDADWLHCRDGKWRPVESGTFPLAHGATARVGRLRAYGNAIVPQAAQAIIEAYLECRP